MPVPDRRSRRGKSTGKRRKRKKKKSSANLIPFIAIGGGILVVAILGFLLVPKLINLVQ